MKKFLQPLFASPERRRDVFLIAAALVFFTICLLRVLFVSFTVDENGSYSMYVFHDIFLLKTYDNHAANHHLLNSWLMWCCDYLFGPSEFSLRLPNLLAYALYLWCMALIVRRIRPAVLACIAFLLLNLHPYLFMYFGLARGYGLSIGLMALALELLFRYTENRRTVHVLAAMLAASVALLANFTQINVYLPFTGILLLLIILRGPWKKRLIEGGAAVAIAGLTLLFVIPLMFKLRDANALYSFAKGGFWSDTVYSLVRSEALGDKRLEGWYMPLVTWMQVIGAVAVVLIAWHYIRQCRKKPSLFIASVVLLTVAAGISVVAQYHLLGTEYITLRMALFFVPLFFLIVAFGFDAMPGPRWLPVGVMSLFVCVLLLNFVRETDLKYNYTGLQSDDNHTLVDMLQDIRKTMPPGKRLMLGVDPEFVNIGFWYYRNTGRLQGIDVCTDQPMLTDPVNDFCFLTAQKRALPPDSTWELYYEFPRTGNLLFRRKNKTPEVTKPVAENFRDFENDVDKDFLSPDAAYHGKYGCRIGGEKNYKEFRFTLNDSVVPGAGCMADVTFYARYAWHSDIRIYVTCRRGADDIGGHEDYMTALIPGDHQWHEVHTRVVFPRTVKRGDYVGINVYAWDKKNIDIDDIRFRILQVNR